MKLQRIMQLALIFVGIALVVAALLLGAYMLGYNWPTPTPTGFPPPDYAATATYGAQQFQIQLTALASTPTP